MEYTIANLDSIQKSYTEVIEKLRLLYNVYNKHKYDKNKNKVISGSHCDADEALGFNVSGNKIYLEVLRERFYGNTTLLGVSFEELNLTVDQINTIDRMLKYFLDEKVDKVKREKTEELERREKRFSIIKEILSTKLEDINNTLKSTKKFKNLDLYFEDLELTGKVSYGNKEFKTYKLFYLDKVQLKFKPYSKSFTSTDSTLISRSVEKHVKITLLQHGFLDNDF